MTARKKKTSTKKVKRKAAKKKVVKPEPLPGQPSRVCMSLKPQVIHQIEMISERLSISKSAVVAQAVARWYHSETLVRKKRRTNVSNRTSVHR